MLTYAFLFSGKGLVEDAISKMMGKPKPRAEPGAEGNEPAPHPANCAAGAPAQLPGAAAASPLKSSTAAAKAAAFSTKERVSAAATGAAAAMPPPSHRNPRPGRQWRSD
jgi:hypothetical protein